MRAPPAQAWAAKLTSLQVRLTSPVLDLQSNLPSIAALSTAIRGSAPTDGAGSITLSNH
jgi:hypothetical protein